MVKRIDDLVALIEDRIPETMEFLERSNQSRKKGYYADWLQKEMTLFLEEVEKKPGFSRHEWGMGTVLMEHATLELPSGQTVTGYVMLAKAGPTLYDCGESREEYMKRMNLRAYLFETGLKGELLAARTITVTVKDLR